MARKERCYKPPVDVPFEALWLKRNIAINILGYNMLYHALKYTYITLLHINLRPNPVLGSNTAPEKTIVCMHTSWLRIAKCAIFAK